MPLRVPGVAVADEERGERMEGFVSTVLMSMIGFTYLKVGIDI